MRLLTFNIEDELIEHIQKHDLYIVDQCEGMEDVKYHTQVRYYNLILIRTNDFFAIKEILENINCRFTAVIVIARNPSKQFLISLLKAGALEVIEEPVSIYKLLTKMEVVHRDNFKNEIVFKDKYSLDLEKEILTSNKSKKKLELKGKPFSMLKYMLKNRHKYSISKDELLNCCWEEPEWVSENIIEVNVNLIRNALKKSFNENFIETIRHRGYKIA